MVVFMVVLCCWSKPGHWTIVANTSHNNYSNVWIGTGKEYNIYVNKMFSLLRSFHGLTRFSSQNSIRLNRVSHHKANALHTTLNTSRSNTSMAYWKSKPSLPICINKKKYFKNLFNSSLLLWRQIFGCLHEFQSIIK